MLRFNGGLIGADRSGIDGVGIWSLEEQNNRRRNRTWAPDADALAYIKAVEAADGMALEPQVKDLIWQFVAGCKADGIWTAIKASCILAGARTLNGALVPLVGTAPTNNNFVSGDYNRKTGLVGNGSTKYLNSNRANNADPQNSNHNAVYISTAEVSGTFGMYIGAGDTQNGSNNLGRASSPATDFLFRSRVTAASYFAVNQGGATGFAGMTRSISTEFTGRVGSISAIYSSTSSAPVTDNVLIFKRATAGITTARLAFYSIGENVNLTLLDGRVSALMKGLSVVLP